MKHADFATLVSLAASDVPKNAAGRIQEHLRKCGRCASGAATAKRLVETVRADRLIEPPDAVVSRAIALWRRERPGGVRRALRVLKAALSFDSFAAPLSTAVRAGASPRQTAHTRRLLYTVDDYDIDLQVERPSPPRGRTLLRGQVLSRTSEVGALSGVAEARIERGARTCATSQLDEHGSFVVGPVTPGHYRLKVRGEAVELIVERLDLS